MLVDFVSTVSGPVPPQALKKMAKANTPAGLDLENECRLNISDGFFKVIKSTWIKRTCDAQRNNKRSKVIDKKAPISCETGARKITTR
ncbi:hypothetical protein [Limnohabitans sp. Rim8]|uniref:hypothetical protein n=1 Tax=Limnohabitans sp. Rim8 TaxID=1100718 RepID=UPI0025F1BA06|nr:hypothetical protein [Limnohabitans sp. Rim8]